MKIFDHILTFATVFYWRKIALFVFCGVALAACSDTHPSNVADCFNLHRLEGRWEFMDNKTYQIEEWDLLTDKELRGTGFVLEGKDTTFIEFLSIKEEKGKLTYFARPSDIHSAEIVPFTLESEGKDKLVFGNSTIDFPKKIVYQLQSDSIMQVYIEGPREGKTTRIVFDFVKQKSV